MTLVVTRTLDPEALGDHVDRLYRAAWAMCGTPHEAEDLVQETFARLLSKPRRLHGEDDLGYLLTALRNTYINAFRTKARRPRLAEMPEAVPLEDVDRSARPHERARSSEVLGYLSSLPEELGAAVMAVDVLGLTLTEAASALRTDVRTLERRLTRGRISVSRHFSAEPVAAVGR